MYRLKLSQHSDVFGSGFLALDSRSNSAAASDLIAALSTFDTAPPSPPGLAAPATFPGLFLFSRELKKLARTPSPLPGMPGFILKQWRMLTDIIVKHVKVK